MYLGLVSGYLWSVEGLFAARFTLLLFRFGVESIEG